MICLGLFIDLQIDREKFDFTTFLLVRIPIFLIDQLTISTKTNLLEFPQIRKRDSINV